LEDDEKMGDEFVKGILTTLTTRYTIVNSSNLVISNYINNETFLNLVKICYGTLLEHAIKLKEGERLPSHIITNTESNIDNNFSRMSINNTTIIKGESGKIYYDKDKKLVENDRLRNCKNFLNVFIWLAIFKQLPEILQYLSQVFLPKEFCAKPILFINMSVKCYY
jgi:hypothetical protein